MGASVRDLVQHTASAQWDSICDARAMTCGPGQRDFAKAQRSLRGGQVQQAGPLEVKADAQPGARQRGVAKPAARACGVARESGDSRLEKRTTLLTNAECRNLQNSLLQICATATALSKRESVWPRTESNTNTPAPFTSTPTVLSTVEVFVINAYPKTGRAC